MSKPEQESKPKRKLAGKFLIDMNKNSAAPAKLAEERALNPVFRRKPRDTTRRTSIDFWESWH